MFVPLFNFFFLLGNDVDRNLSGLETDQHHGGLGVDEVEEEVGNSMPVKEPPSATDKKTLDPSTPVLRPSSPTSLLHIPPSLSITSPTPETSPHRPSVSAPADMKPIPSPSSSSSVLRIPTTTTITIGQPPKIPRTPSVKSKGKRKADDSDITPPDHKKDAQHATFAPLEIRREFSCFFPAIDNNVYHHFFWGGQLSVYRTLLMPHPHTKTNALE